MTDLQTVAKAILAHWDSLRTVELVDAVDCIESLRQALTEHEQEPDYWVGYNPSEGGQFLVEADKPSNEQIALYEFEPVYTAPPKREWVGLTVEEVGELTVFDGLYDVEIPLLADFIRAIEAKLKELNHA